MKKTLFVLIIVALVSFIWSICTFYSLLGNYRNTPLPKREISATSTVNADPSAGGDGGFGDAPVKEAYVIISWPCDGQPVITVDGGYGSTQYVTDDHRTFDYENGKCAETRESKSCASYWKESMADTPVMCAKYFGI